MDLHLRLNLIYLLVFFSFFVGEAGWATNLKCDQLFFNRAGISRSLKWNWFVTSRNLSDYREGFQNDFTTSLQALKSNETWIDLGAGKGFAAIDYLKSMADPRLGANVLLIAYKLDRWFGIPKFKNKLSVLEGRLFEDILPVQLPRTKLITDFFGVLSYTRDLSRSLSLVFDRLEVGGELYVHTQNASTLIDFQNKVYSITEFLKLIDGIKVEGKFGILKITKLTDDVQIPELRLTRLDEEIVPPFRRFAF